MGQTQPPVPRPKRPKVGWGRRILRWIGFSALTMFVFFLISGLAVAGFVSKYVYDVWKALPPLQEITLDLTTKIYDVKGREIVSLHGEENREWVEIEDIPKHVQDAFVSIEDNRFWEHFGIDVYRLAGAVWNDIWYFLKDEGELQGASTITQQLAKNLYLTQDQLLTRKIQEAFIAVQLERTYVKKEILENYLNTIYFGDTAYGLGAAAHTFFGKNTRDLKLEEGAMLAAMLKNPGRFNPYDNLKETKARQELVLDQMVKYGYLTKAERDRAAAAKVNLPGIPRRKVDYVGAHFVDYILNVLTSPALAKKYGLQAMDDERVFRSGYRIYTTLDLDMQKAADEGVAEVMNPNNPARKGEKDISKLMTMPADKPNEWIQAAVVALEPKTGEVKAMVGGRSHSQWRELNRATDSPRQPGSTIKPIVAYLPALNFLGMGTGSVIDDSPDRYDEKTKKMWPENFEFYYRGMQPLRVGIEESVNAMAVRLLNEVGIDRSLKMAQDMGITSLAASGPVSDRGPALALGGLTNGISLLEMTSAYGVIANLGVRHDPVVIRRIEDRRGGVVYRSQPARREVVPPSVAYLMIDLMKGTVQRGTASYFTQRFNDWPSAGKTGTTEDNVDAWFIGFTPDLVTGVWNGYDNRDNVKRELPYTGAWEPVMVWNAVMRKLVKTPPLDWPRPPDVRAVRVCSSSGLLPSPYCHPGEERVELYRARFEPTRVDDVHVQVMVVNEAPPTAKEPVWKLWQEGCTGKPELKSFHKLPRRPVYETPPIPSKDPKWVPRDVAQAAPTAKCTPATVPPGTTVLPGTVPPGAVPPGTVPPGIFPPGTFSPIFPPGNTPPGKTPGQPPGQTPPGTGQQKDRPVSLFPGLPGSELVPIPPPFSPPPGSGGGTPQPPPTRPNAPALTPPPAELTPPTP